jgi:phage baseplate assembly protein gpV
MLGLEGGEVNSDGVINSLDIETTVTPNHDVAAFLG